MRGEVWRLTLLVLLAISLVVLSSRDDHVREVGPAEILAYLEHLYHLLKQDAAGANSVFRQILEQITMTPVEDSGRRFY